MKQNSEQWGLEDRVVVCVHDNAAKIVAANSPTRVLWTSIACFSHILQLAINYGFALHLHRIILVASKLVSHCKRNRCKWALQLTSLSSHVEKWWALVAMLLDRIVTKLQDARILELKLAADGGYTTCAAST